MRRTPGFTQIDNALLRSPTLSMPEKIVYEILLSYDWSGDGCRVKQQRLAAEAPCSLRALRSYLQALESKGLLTIQRGGDGQPSRYRPHRQTGRFCRPDRQILPHMEKTH